MESSFSDKNILDFKSVIYYSGSKCGDFTMFFKNLTAVTRSVGPVLDFLLQNELNDLRQKVIKIQAVSDQDNNEGAFVKHYQLICKKTASFFDIQFDYPTLFLVDELPNEFSKMPWDAMCVDINDERNYKIPAGIYFKKNRLAHPYFDFIISHELIHWIISSFSKEYFPVTSLFEEGLCDFMSYLILRETSLVTGQTISNFIMYNRFLKKNNSLWKNYYSFSKHISNIVSAKGLNFVLELIKKGRNSINELSFFKLDSEMQSENPNNVGLCFNLAESAVVIGHLEYYLFNQITNNKFKFFTEKDLTNGLLAESEINENLKKLVNMGFISMVEDQYYNSYPEIPDNIKFSVPENM